VVIMNLIGLAGFLTGLVYGIIFRWWPGVALFSVLFAFHASLTVFLLKIGKRGTWDKITRHRR